MVLFAAKQGEVRAKKKTQASVFNFFRKLSMEEFSFVGLLREIIKISINAVQQAQR